MFLKLIKKMTKSFISGLFIIIIGIVMAFFNDYKKYSINKINQEKIEDFFKEDKVKTTDNTSNINNNYIAILEIPKINLKRGLISINSKNNNVNYSIEIINSSNMPNIKYGNLILASHSGNSSLSFFNNIDKLVLNDLIYVYYENIKYIYQIINIYEEDKKGIISIKKNIYNTTLTLTTCSKINEDKQLIIIAKKIDKLNYNKNID